MRNVVLTVAMLVFFSFTAAFAASKVPVMNAAGRVLEISDTALKVERSIKGETEVMEFVLENPLRDIGVGDQIKASYRQDNMKYILLRVQKAKKTALKKPVKKGIEKVFDPAASAAAPNAK